MARAQPAQRRESSSKSENRGSQTRGSTPERDEVYGLVSVLYHALQGSDTYAMYVSDAQQAGDDELVRFFEETREQENERALIAKRLLAMRLADEDEEDEEDEAEDEE
jgi:hypothetical protein